MTGNCIVFVDNAADHINYISGIVQQMDHNRILFVCCERSYRRRYIEDACADFDVAIAQSPLKLVRTECQRLIRKHADIGISDDKYLDESSVDFMASKLKGEPISMACCRIQNNFFEFDRIVDSVLQRSDEAETKIYALVGVSRYCYAGGVAKSVLMSASGVGSAGRVGDLYAHLPILFAPGSRERAYPVDAYTH